MMKKDVVTSAVEAVAPKKPEFSLIDEDLLKSRIYTIRGVKLEGFRQTDNCERRLMI